MCSTSTSELSSSAQPDHHIADHGGVIQMKGEPQAASAVEIDSFLILLASITKRIMAEEASSIVQAKAS
ncbi:MAG: hypothetical protein HZC41_08435 [Chloroflexi bacterium]|nr:hypothetical protein [Chloroflexota bacterium]